MRYINCATPKHPNATVMVDDEDYEELNRHKWHLGHGYAKRMTKGNIVLMHRLIMDCPDGYEIDHRDGNEANNQRSNLRICTRDQNAKNRKIGSNNTTGYKGIYPQWGGWLAKVQSGGKYYYGHSQPTPFMAAMEYNKLAKLHHGEFASLNVIRPETDDEVQGVAGSPLTDICYIRLQQERLTLPTPLDAIEQDETRKLAFEAIYSQLSPSELKVIELIYGLADEAVCPHKEIAGLMDFTRQRIYQIEADAIAKLKRFLEPPLFAR